MRVVSCPRDDTIEDGHRNVPRAVARDPGRLQEGRRVGGAARRSGRPDGAGPGNAGRRVRGRGSPDRGPAGVVDARVRGAVVEPARRHGRPARGLPAAVRGRVARALRAARRRLQPGHPGREPVPGRNPVGRRAIVRAGLGRRVHGRLALLPRGRHRRDRRPGPGRRARREGLRVPAGPVSRRPAGGGRGEPRRADDRGGARRDVPARIPPVRHARPAAGLPAARDRGRAVRHRPHRGHGRGVRCVRQRRGVSAPGDVGCVQLGPARPAAPPDELRDPRGGGRVLRVARPAAAGPGRVGAGGAGHRRSPVPVGGRGAGGPALLEPAGYLPGRLVPAGREPLRRPGHGGQRPGVDDEHDLRHQRRHVLLRRRVPRGRLGRFDADPHGSEQPALPQGRRAVRQGRLPLREPRADRARGPRRRGLARKVRAEPTAKPVVGRAGPSVVAGRSSGRSRALGGWRHRCPRPHRRRMPRGTAPAGRSGSSPPERRRCLRSSRSASRRRSP